MASDDIDPNLVVEVDGSDPEVMEAERERKGALDKLQARTQKWLDDRK